MDHVLLEVDDWVDASRWRWRLSAPGGALLGDHQVAVDTTSSEWEAFRDLHRYVRWHVDPAKRLSDEASTVARVGAWAGRELLGGVGRALVDTSPVVVRVRLGKAARALAYLPWELAHVDDRPLALSDVSLVYELCDAPATSKDPVQGALRVLGLFSLPADASALALRRERYELVRLLDTIATRHDKALDVRVLQYGVTRQLLGDVLEEGPGWDVVHFSGHGRPGEVALELPDGSTDVVSGADLVGLLRKTRRRLKLVTLSACSSATATAAESLRLVGIEPPDPDDEGDDAPGASTVLPALAQDLVADLGCAVVAMRYPVVDDFAVDLAQGLYDRLVRQAQPLARALQNALAGAVRQPPTPGTPAISVATPALFGASAAELSLAPPQGARPAFDPKLAGLVPEPERFVGRVGPLARAGAALVPPAAAPAPPGGRPTGVLFLGMAGAGKSTAAAELVYRHHGAFRVVVWHKAPDLGADVTASLASFALDVEAKLAQAGIAGLSLVASLDNAERLERALGVLSQLMATTAVLVVLDNVESLLSEQGTWRDPRWGGVVTALSAHQGPGRVVLTSRLAPAGTDPHRVTTEPVNALSLSESVLLARQLPHLGPLARGEAEGVDPQEGWALVHQVLGLVQGHPKLLELADGEAVDPAKLRVRLGEAEAAWAGAGDVLGAFLATGRSQVGEGDYLEVLEGWATAAVGALPEQARMAFACLCALEEGDRHRGVAETNWVDLWARLGCGGQAPEWAPALAPALAATLVEAAGDSYRVHPVVAGAGRHSAPAGLQAAVDAELAAFWQAVFHRALGAEGGEQGEWVVHAGQAATPYLVRLEEWGTAGALLEQVLYRDQSPQTVGALVPQFRHLAQAALGTEDELVAAGRLAKALRSMDPVEAEASLRSVVEAAVSRGEFRVASAVAGDLANLLTGRGRLGEALAVVDEMIGYTARAGLGSWTQLSDDGQRLQLLVLMGRDEEVLQEVARLRERMANLPAEGEADEAVHRWNVQQGILGTGRQAARNLQRWQEALALNAEVVKMMEERGAPVHQVARTRFNDYFPLVRLGRPDVARTLLRWCREVFEAERDGTQLGNVFGGLALVEDELGHRDEAIGLEQRSLGYAYAAEDVDGVAVSHHNLSNYLGKEGEAGTALSHRLAAAVVWFQMDSGQLASTLSALAAQLAASGARAPVPTFAQVCADVGAVEGVDLARLVDSLPGRAASGEEALAQLLALAPQVAAQARADRTERLVEKWRPLIGGVVAAARGERTEAAGAVGPELDELAGTADWGALVAALRRVLAGERDQSTLADGLDEVDRAVLAEVLAQLGPGR